MHKSIIIGFLIFTLVALYGFLPPLPKANAVDSIKDASDTISDSDLGETATHVLDFTTGTTTPTNGYIDVVFHNDFGDVATGSIACPDFTNWASSSPNTETARCTAQNNRTAGTYQITVSGMVNPNADGNYDVYIYNYDDTSTLKERVHLKVYIIEDVLMTAKVDATLNFQISGVASGAKSVNGVLCDETTTATATPFGTLQVNATTTVCQKLNVTTNADDGFTVTVEQDQELTSDGASNINSFNNSQDGTGTTTAEGWAPPSNILDYYNTYGHMGLTSDDQDLSSYGTGYNDFYNSGGAPHFAGLNSTDPMPIMHHTGPSDGSTQNKGEAFVAYSAQIASLQEAGDYENTLTYICTPTF